MSPELPDHCPLGANGSCCHIKRHARRQRKAGPGFALVIVVCTEHRRHYTLYPLGFTPYARARIAKVSGDGQGSAMTASDLSFWDDTRLETVIDQKSAAQTGHGLEPGTRSRRRQLGFTARVLGLTGEARVLERAALVLEVDLLLLTTSSAAYARARGMLPRARAIEPVLAALPRSGPLLFRLLCAGTLSGVFGGAWWWSAGSGYLRSFQGWERR